jgi:hypothetical protein
MLKHTYQRLLRIREKASQRGQILVMSALILPTMFGFAGIAIDVGLLMVYRSEYQHAADAAAIAGAQAWLEDGQSSARPLAERYAEKNGFVDGVDDTEVSVSFPASCGVPATTGNCVQVNITKTNPTFFIRILGKSEQSVGASAVARIINGPRPYALIVLDETACPAYNHSGTGNLILSGGGAIVNSNGTSGSGGDCPGMSAQQTGGAIINADLCYTSDSPPVEVPCTLDHLSGTGWEHPEGQASPLPTTVNAPVPDPLATMDRPEPCTDLAGTTPSGCIKASPDSGGTATAPLHKVVPGNATLRPGTYYGGLTINGGSSATVTFMPGLYVMAGGEGNTSTNRGFRWRSSGSATISGLSSEGVTIYNTDNSAATASRDRPCGALDVASSGTLALRAPADSGAKGPWDDNPVDDGDRLDGVQLMLFWQDDSCTETFKYTGTSHTARGIFYLPEAALDLAGGGSIGAIQVIVDKLDYTGSGNTTITYENYITVVRPSWSLVE